MKKAILIRIGELFLKGKNKHIFEKALFDNIKKQLKKYDYEFNLYKISGRFVVNKYDENFETSIISALKNVFGIHSISPAVYFETNYDSIVNYVDSIRFTQSTFKVNVNRADKRFEHKSMDFQKILGGVVINNHPNIKVNLSNPEVTVFVDIRENGETFIFNEIIKGAGGMPVGTSGGAMLMLSGGIDSPVSGYLMAKRGLSLQAIHYHSFPYTSEQAKQKVITLAKTLTNYTGSIKLHIVPFTKIQEDIHKNCNPEYMITLMRRFMMKIAERISLKEGLGAIITGESLAQVASQTTESITITNNASEILPVFRPLIAMDKEEIIKIARDIKTFETSILPYEDCCTVFLPDHPIIKPKLEKVQREESKLEVDSLIDNAIGGIEVLIV